MTSAENILRNETLKNEFKFLEVGMSADKPKLRGVISAIEIKNIVDQVIDLQINLNYCNEQRLGQNDWVSPETPVTSLAFKFHENKFSFLGLNASPIFIIWDEDGNEYLIFKPDDNYVKKEKGFQN